MTLDQCEGAFAEIRATTSFSDLERLVDDLLGSHRHVIRFGLGRGSIFWRARPCEKEGYSNLKDMTYPPSSKATVGRLSEEKQPRFYASARKHTALAEQLECQRGPYFHIVGLWVVVIYQALLRPGL
jgi:hypothetical protein